MSTENLFYVALAAGAAVFALFVLIVLKITARQTLDLSIRGFGVEVNMKTAAEVARRQREARNDRDTYETDRGGLIEHKPID